MNHSWDSIYGQNKIKEQLQFICNSRRVPHAFIFSGSSGVGKFNTAIHFAKYLIIQQSPKNEKVILDKITNLQEPYVKFILPLPRGKGELSDDSATEKLSQNVLQEIREAVAQKSSNPYSLIKIENANTIKINSIREIGKFVNISIDEGILRFILIQDAHLMNENAQNALLKNLEEPPEGVIFILITDKINLLLPTIISRSRVIEFEPLSPKMIELILINEFQVDERIAKRVSQLAEGSVNKALEIMTLDLDKIFDTTISILRYSFGKKYSKALKEFENFIAQYSEDSLIVLIQLLKSWFLDLYKIKSSFEEIIFINNKDTLEKFNERYPNVSINSIINFLDNTEVLIKKNMNLNVIYANIIFELAAVARRK